MAAVPPPEEFWCLPQSDSAGAAREKNNKIAAAGGHATYWMGRAMWDMRQTLAVSKYHEPRGGCAYCMMRRPPRLLLHGCHRSASFPARPAEPEAGSKKRWATKGLTGVGISPSVAGPSTSAAP